MTAEKIYISGPIKMDREGAPLRFRVAADYIKSLGHVPVNPFDCPPICIGHPTTIFEPDPDDGHYDCYMRGDIASLVLCDSLLLLPNWHLSKGAKLEIDIALGLNMKIYPDKRHLIAA